MKRTIAAIAIMLSGCATTSSVRNLSKRIDGLNTQIIQLIDARDKRDQNMVALEKDIRKHLEGFEDVTLTCARQSQRRDAKIDDLGKRLGELETFKVEHDKRWPPKKTAKTIKLIPVKKEAN